TTKVGYRVPVELTYGEPQSILRGPRLVTHGASQHAVKRTPLPDVPRHRIEQGRGSKQMHLGGPCCSTSAGVVAVIGQKMTSAPGTDIRNRITFLVVGSPLAGACDLPQGVIPAQPVRLGTVAATTNPYRRNPDLTSFALA